MKTCDATRLKVQLVPGYMRLDRATNSMVPSYPRAFPGRKDAPIAPIVALANALADSFEADEPNYRWYRDGRCYLMQCEPWESMRGEGPRLAGKAWEVKPIMMRLLLTDVDASGKKEPGFDSGEWWRSQASVLQRFTSAHPGAFIASSRGGLRIYQVLADPFDIDCQQRADEWKARYVTWIAHVREFGWQNAAQGGADELKDWTRLQRIPHDTRDGVLQQLPVWGDPTQVGLVELPPPAKDVKPRTALRPYNGPVSEASVPRFVVQSVADILPRQGDGVHEAVFALGGLMSAAEWSSEDCAQMVYECFLAAGISREDVFRTATLSVATARSGGKTYGWARFVTLCRGTKEQIDMACRDLREHVPGLGKNCQWFEQRGLA